MSEVKLTKKQEQQQRAAKARASRVEMLERQLAEARAKEAERNVTRIETKAAELAKSMRALERQSARVATLREQFVEMFESIHAEYGPDRAEEVVAALNAEHNIGFIIDTETPAQAEARVDAETDAETEQPTLFDLPEEGPTPESLETPTPKKRRGKTATV